MLKTLIVIPVRMSSSRFPGKPLVNIKGRTMIEKVWQNAKKSKIGDVVVACCDKEIEKVLTQKGIKYVYTKKGLESGSDRVLQAYEKIKDNTRYDLIINLQGDIPLVNPNHLRKLKNLFYDKKIKMGTLVSLIKDKQKLKDYNIVKVAICKFKNDIYKALYFSRLPIPYQAKKYYEHIGIYGFRPEILKQFVDAKKSNIENYEKLEQLRALENNIDIHLGIVKNPPISIDTPNDLKSLIKHLNLKVKV